jgi:hypothetical protein
VIAVRLRRCLAPDLPEVLSPMALVLAFSMLALSAITDNDAPTYGAGVGLLIDAFFVRVRVGLRER